MMRRVQRVTTSIFLVCTLISQMSLTCRLSFRSCAIVSVFTLRTSTNHSLIHTVTDTALCIGCKGKPHDLGFMLGSLLG
jgi:hypothetical protein